MFKKMLDPDVNGWQVGERKLKFISHLINQFFKIGLLEVIVYFILIVMKFKLSIDFINTAEYITLIQTVNYFYLGAGSILSGIYTYGNTQEWRYRGNNIGGYNDNANANYVAPNNSININIPKQPQPPSTNNTSVFNPPKGDV